MQNENAEMGETFKVMTAVRYTKCRAFLLIKGPCTGQMPTELGVHIIAVRLLFLQMASRQFFFFFFFFFFFGFFFRAPPIAFGSSQARD